MSRPKNVETRETEDGGMEVILRGKAAIKALEAAERKGTTVEALCEAVLRDAIARGVL